MTLAAIAGISLLATACLNTEQPSFGLDCSTLATNLASTTNLTTKPSGLQYRDVVVGPGAVVTAGSRVTTQYSACLTTGEVFSEASGTNHLSFTVGQGQVFPGLDEGVQGMRLGGRRQLVIPPALGYGANGSVGGFSVPNATFVMTIDAQGLQ